MTGVPWGATRIELESRLAAIGYSKSHARAMFSSMYRTPLLPWGAHASLPASCPNEFGAKGVDTVPLKIAMTHLSGYDRSVKMVIALMDGLEIETVLMPEKGRITVCISSQVGCRLRCVFCHTGRMGLVRNLSAAEIILQMVLANQFIEDNPRWLKSTGLPPSQRVTNVVFMGMGEPMDNVENVLRAIDILSDPWGLGIGHRKITVSTAGKLDGLKWFFEREKRVSLAFSLHAVTDRERTRLMPINREFGLEDLTGWMRRNAPSYRREFMIQYTVINGVNDSPAHAQKILELLRDIPCKVNLIPLNPVAPSKLNCPEPGSLERFRDALHKGGVRVMVRYSKGQDIGAACGQLVRSRENRYETDGYSQTNSDLEAMKIL